MFIYLSLLTKQDPMGGLSETELHPSPLLASCLWKVFSFQGLFQLPKNKFNQINEQMQKQRKTVKPEKIIMV